ncbi:hypothetical protein C8J35_1239 [Rhizobium sp. PP-F2F-G38]|nr:hypothetical protein C8J35_1239 [Rhizobium sp. PP-F2F-G38]
MSAFADEMSLSDDGQLISISLDDLDDIAGAGWQGRADAIGGGFAAGALGGYSSGLSHGQSFGVGVAGALSAGTSGASSGRVICTHFYRKGMLDRDVWRADIEFTATRLSARTVRGYQYWAIPYVKLMRRSAFAEKIMYPLALARAEELAYRMKKREKGNWKGKIVRVVGESICFSIGCFVGEQNWQQLWVDDGAKS